MNLVEAVVTEVTQEPTFETPKGWSKPVWVVKFKQNCYGNITEQTEYCFTKKYAECFKVGYKFMT